jgi:predicted AAA+ superfamily ATPase
LPEESFDKKFTLLKETFRFVFVMDKQKLTQIVADQQELGFKSTDLERLSDLGPGKEILVISGVRRCGKSTLLNEIRHKSKESDYYFNFDDERLIDFNVDDFQDLYEVFLELFGKQVTFYFDEIQNIPGWERFVRRLYDYNNKVYITGSNASMLSRELGTHLTGRYTRMELYPFSFSEYLSFTKFDYSKTTALSTQGKSEIKSRFNNYFRKGGFPTYVETGNKQYLKSLYESILYRDVMVRNSLTNEKELLELVHFMASNTSKLFSYNSLAKVIGVKNATTIKNYLDYLQNTYLLFLVSKYDRSVKKQLHNPKKGYFVDFGLVRELGFHHSEDNGRLLENLVFIELKRRGKEIYYHHQKYECDFVLKEKNEINEAIQVSWSVYDDLTRKREIDGLTDALKCYGLKEGLIITEDEDDIFNINDFKIIVKPAWKWLLGY